MNISTPSQQQGASVTTIVLLIIALGLLGKLAIAVIPAYVGDYQFTKLVAQELQKANGAKQTDKQFLNSLSTQLSINANYDAKPEENAHFYQQNPRCIGGKKPV